MSRSPIAATFPAAILAAALGVATLPEPAAAQSPSALDMIQRLQPGSGTRGIRRPVETDGSVQPAPTLTPAAPSAAQPPMMPPVMTAPAAVSAAPRPPQATGPRPSQATAGAPAPMATTAPADVPAISITVQFSTGSWTLSPAAANALTPLGQALTSPQLSAYRFRIEGHTDSVGADASNRELSQRRAEAVRDYLVKTFRVPGERLEAIGLGESQLLVPTPDNVPEARNRRVQVLNLGS